MFGPRILLVAHLSETPNSKLSNPNLTQYTFSIKPPIGREVSRTQFIPYVTFGVIAWCVIVFLALNSSKSMTNVEGMKFGFFTLTEIYEGRWWALITSAFCHVEITHIFFNMYWLWILGPVIERQFGAVNFLAFVIGTAFISSGWQLATSHTGDRKSVV